MITATAHAKLNLSLNITGRRPDGYHELHALTVFTQWGDLLTLTPSSHFQMDAEGPHAHIFDEGLSCTSHKSPNLIAQAVHMMASLAGRAPDIHIHIVKNIPAGAGLGGASSDAATVMHMLNDYWSLGLSLETLCALGLRLGADIPVCLHGRSSVMSGIGEVIRPVALPSLPILIVWPDAPLSTQEVFARYRDSGQGFSEAEDYNGDALQLEAWLRDTGNDLTGAAIELCPAVGEVLSALQARDGIRVARMSGSGSACFGIFETEAQVQCAAATFSNAIVTNTLTSEL